MSPNSQLKYANRNLRVYMIKSIFVKRVFLPLTPVYFVQQCGISVKELGFIAAFYALCQLLSEIPSGYLADKFSRSYSLRFGALLSLAATIIYIFFPNRFGVYSGQIFEAVGYTFFAGAGEALVHDSLVVKKQEHRYSHILSRTQSIALIINAVLVSTVPLTYAIDPRWPFAIGAAAFIFLFIAACFSRDLTLHKQHHKIEPFSLTQLASNPRLLIFIFILGIFSAFYVGPSYLFNSTFTLLGMPAQYLGWIYGGASIIGAFIGLAIPHLKKIPLVAYGCLDACILILTYGSLYFRSPAVTVACYVLQIGFWRYRKIIYQNHLLEMYPTRYKATLLSGTQNMEEIHSLWVPLAVTSVSFGGDVITGLTFVALATLLLLPVYVFVTGRLIRYRQV